MVQRHGKKGGFHAIRRPRLRRLPAEALIGAQALRPLQQQRQEESKGNQRLLPARRKKPEQQQHRPDRSKQHRAELPDARHRRIRESAQQQEKQEQRNGAKRKPGHAPAVGLGSKPATCRAAAPGNRASALWPPAA